jgi:rubredoxin
VTRPFKIYMLKYKCSVCGYLYEPDLGDPDGGAPAGAEFKEVYGGWTCPICGAPKEQFEEESE